MKIAMPYQDGVLLEHFGRAKEFIIYNVSDLDPVTSEVIAPEDLSHAAVARVLKEHGVNVVLCGSIGEHARQAVEGEHMLVFSGITGQIHARLENVFVDFPAVRHAVNCQQRGFKRTASESAQKDVRVVGREQPLAENAQIVLQRRKKLDGGFRWNCHDSAHILSLFYGSVCAENGEVCVGGKRMSVELCTKHNGGMCVKPMVITHEMCYTICNETSRGGLFQCN